MILIAPRFEWWVDTDRTFPLHAEGPHQLVETGYEGTVGYFDGEHRWVFDSNRAFRRMVWNMMADGA